MNIQNIIDKHLRNRSLLSYLLAPLGYTYGVIQDIRRLLYKIEISKAYNSKIAVISVGNIVSGGSGKTPFSIFLAQFLTNNGKKVVISHRGYKGLYENENCFISDRKKLFKIATNAGDEPLLLAKSLPTIPIIVGRDRTASVKMVEQTYPDTDYIILDDSFQHLKVKHNFDFLVFNSGFGVGNGFTLPAGLLRESIANIKYSSALIWNELSDAKVPRVLQNSNIDLVKFAYKPIAIYDRNGKDIAVSEINKGRNALLSGIGFPQGFENTSSTMGITFKKHFRLPDHYDFSNKTFLTQLKKSFKEEHFNHLIITEKDYVKIANIPDFDLPYYVLKVALQLKDKQQIDLFSKLLL